MTGTSKNELPRKLGEKLAKALDECIHFWREKQFQEPEVILLTRFQRQLLCYYCDVEWRNGLKYRGDPLDDLLEEFVELLGINFDERIVLHSYS